MEGSGDRQTAAKGELEKVNLDGCKTCSRVYVSKYNAKRIGTNQGWKDLEELTALQGPNSTGQDIVIRIRSRVSQLVIGGLKTCDKCR